MVRKTLRLTACLSALVLNLAAVAPGAAAPAKATGQPVADAPQLTEWGDLMTRFKAVGEEVIAETADPADPQSRQDSWDMMFAQLVRGYLVGVYADPSYPEFVPSYNPGLNVAAPNPDYMYSSTPLDGSGVYRLRGFKGTNRFSWLQFVATNFIDPVEKDKNGGFANQTLGGFTLDELKSGSDGAFDVLLSNERPQGYTGEWRKLDPATRGVFMRAASYDWLHERSPIVSIERLDVPARRPRPTAQEISAKLASLPGFLKRDSTVWLRHMADMSKRGMWNKIEIQPWGAFPGQVYLEGLYRLKPDEALIVETAIPSKCRYWSFLVGDMQFRTNDWVNHQSSLNGFQAKLDSDGKFRAVIADSDPGVPNWLDSSGYREGIIQGRWNLCDSQPVPTARVVKLSEVRRFLPKDTPVTTPQEREAQLRDRRMGAQLRRKW